MIEIFMRISMAELTKFCEEVLLSLFICWYSAKKKV